MKKLLLVGIFILEGVMGGNSFFLNTQANENCTIDKASELITKSSYDIEEYLITCEKIRTELKEKFRDIKVQRANFRIDIEKFGNEMIRIAKPVNFTNYSEVTTEEHVNELDKYEFTPSEEKSPPIKEREMEDFIRNKTKWQKAQEEYAKKEGEFVNIAKQLSDISQAMQKLTGYEVILQEPIGGESRVLCNDPNGGKVKCQNGVELFKAYLLMVYKYSAGLIGLICVGIIAFYGVMMTFIGISPDQEQEAKDKIMQALFSLILVFTVALILNAINPGFFTF